jgi:hypothetical protein
VLSCTSTFVLQGSLQGLLKTIPHLSNRERGPSPLKLRRRAKSGSRRTERGQGIAEFAIIVPILLLLVMGIGDFGRLYSSAVAVEAAAREAADYGAFDSNQWTTANQPITASEMERRACTAASKLPDYSEPAGTVNHATCTNPTFSYCLEGTSGSSCPASPPFDCWNPPSNDTCVVHVIMAYQFHTIVAIAPFPSELDFSRESRFAVSDHVTP